MNLDPEDLTLELLWSLWTELGVPGVIRHHQGVAIDIEPLVVSTPYLAGSDSRLLALAGDWCRIHRRWLSATRLEGLRAASNQVSTSRSLESTGRSAGPGSRKVMALPTDRPALVRLRIRALLGVSTRAEVLARLLAASDAEQDVAGLMPEGISRRSVERCLSDLLEGGLVRVRGPDRGRVYRLRDGSGLARFLTAGDLTWPRWGRELEAVRLIVDLVRRPPTSNALGRVQALRFHDAILETGSSILFPCEPPPVTGRGDAFEAVLEWGCEQLRRLASGEAFAGVRRSTAIGGS